MLSAILRKSRQFAADPVLRRWLAARVLKRTPGEPAFTPHHPPYLGSGWQGLALEQPSVTLARLPAGAPNGPLRMRLAGATVTIPPGGEAEAVAASFDDIEAGLSLHRFAWVPLMEPDADPRWVNVLWQAWAQRFGTLDDGWAWHPYTAAERAINLLTFARRHGLPDGAADLLATHAPVIAKGLEWFGDHHTSNHCANNGRGLYLLGLGLGLPAAAEAGACILLAEGRRIFRDSGVLREASTHYHLLLTRQWASVWLAACAQDRPEAAEFERILRRALAVLPAFALPGGFPLMGDVSPDCPPSHLFGLLPHGDATCGWTGLLNADDRAALAALWDGAAPDLAGDGWLRQDVGPWSGLWHAEPAGWSPMPGHGHQDCGAAEIHFDGEAIFVDPGRGSYESAGEADPYVAAGVHGTLTLDGLDPYPPNKPYYAPDFRAAWAGPADLTAEPDGVRLTHRGYARLGVPEVLRHWQFDQSRMVIEDAVDGRGTHRLDRRMITGLPVTLVDGAAVLTTCMGRRLRVSAPDGAPELAPLILWSAYGEGRPGTAITFSAQARLPWRGTILIEVL